MTDLQAAEADAVAHNDRLAAPCYVALEAFVAALPSPGQRPVGGFSAFQMARDLRHGVEGGMPVDVKMGCAALFIDEAQLVAKIAAIGGGVAVGLPPGLPLGLPLGLPPAGLW